MNRLLVVRGVQSALGSLAKEVVTKALKKSADVAENAKLRTGLITKYGSE